MVVPLHVVAVPCVVDEVASVIGEDVVATVVVAVGVVIAVAVVVVVEIVVRLMILDTAVATVTLATVAATVVDTTTLRVTAAIPLLIRRMVRVQVVPAVPAATITTVLNRRQTAAIQVADITTEPVEALVDMVKVGVVVAPAEDMVPPLVLTGQVKEVVTHPVDMVKAAVADAEAGHPEEEDEVELAEAKGINRIK